MSWKRWGELPNTILPFHISIIIQNFKVYRNPFCKPRTPLKRSSCVLLWNRNSHFMPYDRFIVVVEIHYEIVKRLEAIFDNRSYLSINFNVTYYVHCYLKWCMLRLIFWHIFLIWYEIGYSIQHQISQSQFMNDFKQWHIITKQKTLVYF